MYRDIGAYSGDGPAWPEITYAFEVEDAEYKCSLETREDDRLYDDKLLL